MKESVFRLRKVRTGLIGINTGLSGEGCLYYYHKGLDATIPLLNVQFTTYAVNSYYIRVRPEYTVVLYYYCFLRINYTHVHCSDLILSRRRRAALFVRTGREGTRATYYFIAACQR